MFLQATRYTSLAGIAFPPRTVDLLVVHAMQTGEGRETAENVAAGWAKPSSPDASCHFLYDSTSEVQCVRENDVAWHARGANRNSIGFEISGMSEQTYAEWCDDYSRAALNLAARRMADVCVRRDIPVKVLNATDLAIPGARGITTHNSVSLAFKKSDHWDPGPNFPMDWFIEKVREYVTWSRPPMKVDILEGMEPKLYRSW